jgi:hypothetical protein
MTDTTYNGWTNRQTWLVNLWLDEAPYMTESISNICLGFMGSWEEKSDIDWRLGDEIKNLVEEWVFENQIDNGLATDLLTDAMGLVNFREIAGHYYDELKEVTA